MAAIPPPINTLPALIDRHHEKVSERPRFHMGASALGHHCDRWLWLSFRWVVVQTFPGRMLRLFRRGHMEEDVLMADMRAVGIEFSGAQASVDFGGFVCGSADAVIESGVPEAPRRRHVAEFKTHNRASFKALVKDGVRKSKPIHWAQMQVYMLGLEIDRALYVAVCKDDDSLYSERVRLDVDKARGLVERGHRISQSDRLPRYRAALQRLWDMGLIYPCTCSRADIRAAAGAPQEGAPLQGPDGIVYPGTCRPASPPTGPLPDTALRLDMARALARLGQPPAFTETGAGPDGETGTITPDDMATRVGDVALARPGMGAAYHLAIVIDDAEQAITHVIRGRDLFDATQIHVLLQRLLGLPTPLYHHHRLIRDETGKRLAKRDDARAIATYRAEGATPCDIRAMVGL